ncbi:MAG: cytochrome c biogenesis protein CcsA [Pirellulales bacterium]|nr:cytochrome c biogenesis protein CcsA [Pirellulales bacterium]
MSWQIQIICFAASYSVALALEVTRLFLRSGLRGAAMVAFAGAGLLAQTIFLAQRAAQTAVPLSSEFDWYLVAAWLLVVLYLYLMYYHPRAPLGLFLLPVVLALIGIAAYVADRHPFPETRASLVWGSLHGVLLLLGTVTLIVGFVTGVMYLVGAYRLKHKLPPTRRFQLPSLEWLQRMNGRSIGLAVILLGLGVLSGAVLNVVNHSKQAEYVPWNDPVIVSSLVLVGWLVAVTVFNTFYKPARTGRKTAYLTLASFVLLVLALGISLLGESGHGGAPARDAIPSREGAA